jgi:predicted molibdopterin-dependent oxidoreductase YjgC
MPDDHVRINIDGQELAVPPHTTILGAIRASGDDVPVICYHPATQPNGLCRICVVDTGGRVLEAACVTVVREGMAIETRSERVEQSRRTILSMLAASVNLTGAPAIQGIAAEYGVATDAQSHRRNATGIMDDNPFFVRDYDQCVLCWRCVQVCGEDAQYTFALTFEGRGYETTITTAYAQPLPESPCVFCGQCIGVCPTGALNPKTEWALDQGLTLEPFQRLKGRRSS